MPVLENQRHEIFAQEIAKGKTASESYVLAGFKPNRANASRLKANSNIVRRVLELSEAGATRAEITLEGILRELDEAISIAKQKGQPNALINAAQLRAKLGGLLIEKAEIAVTTEQTEPQSTAEVLASVLERVGEKAARALADAFNIEYDEAAVMALVNDDVNGNGVNSGVNSARAIEWLPPKADRKRQVG
jgi:hypothetical protein